jgi:hypothetical protein
VRLEGLGKLKKPVGVDTRNFFFGGGFIVTKFEVLKVPRQCSLVLFFTERERVGGAR